MIVEIVWSSDYFDVIINTLAEHFLNSSLVQLDTAFQFQRSMIVWIVVKLKLEDKIWFILNKWKSA